MKTFPVSVVIALVVMILEASASMWIGGQSTVGIVGQVFTETRHDSIYISNFDVLQIKNSNFTGMLKIFIDASTPFTTGATPQVYVQNSRFTADAKLDPASNTMMSTAQVWISGGPQNTEFFAYVRNNVFFDSVFVVANMTAPKKMTFVPFTFDSNTMILAAAMYASEFGSANITCGVDSRDWGDLQYASPVTFCGLARVETGGYLKLTNNQIENIGQYFQAFPTAVLFLGDIDLLQYGQVLISGNTLTVLNENGAVVYVGGGLSLSQYSQFVFSLNNVVAHDGGEGLYVMSGMLTYNNSVFAVTNNSFYCPYGEGLRFDDDINIFSSEMVVTGNTFNIPANDGNGIAMWGMRLSFNSTLLISANSFVAHFGINPLSLTISYGSSMIVSANTFTIDDTSGVGGAAIGSIDYVSSPSIVTEAVVSVIGNSKVIVEKNTITASTVAKETVGFFVMSTTLSGLSVLRISRNEFNCLDKSGAYSDECDIYNGGVTEDFSSKFSLSCNQYNGNIPSSGGCMQSWGSVAATSSPAEICPALNYVASQDAAAIVEGGNQRTPDSDAPVAERGFPAVPTRSIRVSSSGTGHWRSGSVQVGVPVSLLDLRGSSSSSSMSPCGSQQKMQCPLMCFVPTNCSGFANQLVQRYIFSAVTSGNAYAAVEHRDVLPNPLSPGKRNCTEANSQAVRDVIAFSKSPQVVFRCHAGGEVAMYALLSNGQRPIEIWRGLSGVPDAYWGVTFECSACLPIGESGLNPQSTAIIVFAVLKAVVVVYGWIYFSKKFKLVPARLLGRLASLKHEYWHSEASAGGTSANEVMYPEELTPLQVEGRLREIIANFHGDGTLTSARVPPGFAAFYAEQLSFGGLRMPIVNATSEIGATVVGVAEAFERWMPTELGDVITAGGSPKADAPLARGEDAGGYQQESARESAGAAGNRSAHRLVGHFSRMTVTAAVEEARRILKRYIDGPQMQRVVLRSHSVRACYIPPAWVIRINAGAVAILFITSFSDAYVISTDRYTWLYFRMFNSTATATLIAAVILRSVYTQRVAVRRLYSEPHIFLLSVALFPALFSHVLVGAIVYVWVFGPILAVGIGAEALAHWFCPKATDDFSLAATASVAAKTQGNVLRRLREKFAAAAFSYPILEHMIRLVGRVLFIASIVITTTLVFNYAEGYVHFNRGTQTSIVSRAGYGTAVGAMHHDYDARSNVCLAADITTTVSAWWSTMVSLFGPF